MKQKIKQFINSHETLVTILVITVVFLTLLFTFSILKENPFVKKFQSNLPYNEKIAEGVFIKHNQDSEHFNFGENKDSPDLNLREVKISTDAKAMADKQKSGEADANDNNAMHYDVLKYRWNVSLPSGTKFEFGGVPPSREASAGKEGKVLPVVKVTNKDRVYVAYAPRLPITDERLKNNENEKSSGQKSSIINHYVTPTVKGNVISWEIADGITARYTMQEDRVKADYIISERSKVKSSKLEFDFEYSKGADLVQEPDGQISLISNKNEAFRIPLPEVSDKNNSKFTGKYALNDTGSSASKVFILLPKKDLKKAVFPLTVDPVVIDSAASNLGTAYGNARKIMRDAYGNLIAIFDGGTGNDNVWYKNYNSSSWTDANIDIDGGASTSWELASDLDSTGDVHVSFVDSVDEDLKYAKLSVTRDGSNLITSISKSSLLALDTSNWGFRPSLIVANKDGGSGVEKVVIAYSMKGGTRSEVRIGQCDVSDDCTSASNWKNTSEEKNGSGTCTDADTGGNSGIPNATTCKGFTDKVLEVATNTSVQTVITQFPGGTKRSPDSVKWDDNGVFSDLTNTIDGSTGTTNNVNSLTTTDYIYVGDSKPFSKVTIDITNTNSNTTSFAATTIEYCSLSYDGATCDTWSDLNNFVDNTDNGTSTFSEDGSILFDELPNWVTNTVNSTSGKYWIRLRPSAAFDATVSIAEIYINDRNSQALLITAGVNSTDDLGASYVVWDEIGNAGWENNPAATGDPPRDGITALDTLGGNWSTYTNFPLTTTVDFKNNRIYVAYVEDNTTDVLHVVSIGNNLDPTDTVANTWDDARFPTVTEAGDLTMSLTSDGADIYLFYILNPGTNNLVFRKCSPDVGENQKICDGANDWGSEKALYSDTTISYPSAIVTKATSDLIAIDTLFTDTTDLDVLYEKHFVDMMDDTTTVSVSGDDAFHRDCASGTDDQDIVSTTVKLGAEDTDTNCVSNVDSENHAGFRFPSVSVAPGAKISSAYIDLRVSTRTGTGNIDFTIYGEDTDNSSAYSAQTNCTAPCSGNVGERTRTTSSSVQAVDAETNTYRFDVTDIVQEIVCRGVIDSQPCIGDFNGSGTWASGNALSILMISSEGGAADNYINIIAQDDTGGILEPTLQINLADTGNSSKPQQSNWCELGTAGGNGSNDCNTNWGAREKVAFDNSASSENLTNFPALIRLDSTKIDYSKTMSAGEDLRFVDATGGAVLKYEIETWDETGESLVWVRVPQINASSATDYVYMYYDNSSASAGQDVANTWNSVYAGVWHLDEDPTTTLYDATGVNNGTGESLASTDQKSSLIDGGVLFHSDPDQINAGSDSSMDDLTSFSRSAWIYLNSYPAGSDHYTISSKGSSRWNDWFFLSLQNGKVGLRYYRSYSGGASYAHCYQNTTVDLIEKNQWHHVAMSYDESSGNPPDLYIDGRECTTYSRGTGTAPITNYSAYNFYIGGSNYQEMIDGRIDETRFAKSFRSGDWLEAEYLNTKPDSTYVSIAEEETQPTVSSYSSSYESEILHTSGLVGYYRLGETSGTIAKDLSSTGNDGTIYNVPTFDVTGAILGDDDKAMTFNGTDEYIKASDNNAYDFGTGDWSVEFWIDPSSWGAEVDYLVSHGGNGSGDEWETRSDGTEGQFSSRFWDGTQVVTTRSGSDSNFVESGWHHVVIVYDRDVSAQWYIDGVASGSPGAITAGTSTSIGGNYSLWIARRNATLYYDGSLDEVAIYNTALTEDQIQDHYKFGKATDKFDVKQYSKGVSIATGSASFSDLDASFASADYVATQGDDDSYVNVSTDLNISASTSALPTFMFKVNNSKNANNSNIDVSAVVKSNVSTTNYPIYLQVYRAGTTDDWVTVASDNSTAAGTDITLTGVTVDTNKTDYYINETSGVGTTGAECTSGTLNCWAYFRIYQDIASDNYNQILSVDQFSPTFSSGAVKLGFSNAHRYFPTNTCSGSTNSFTVETQDDSGNPFVPTQSTVVRITSSSGGTFTVYSDSSCTTTVTNGDFTFTTSDSSKTFYIKDTGISNDYKLTASVQSGDVLTSGAHYYTIEGGPRKGSRTRIKGSGDTRIRGGTRFK